MAASKKLYEALADSLARLRPDFDNPTRPRWDAICDAIATNLKQDNMRFDTARFKGACETRF